MSTEEPKPTIHELMGRILSELPAIGKNQKNTEQGFMFRGVDDVLNALNPTLAKHGVFYVPDVLERVAEKRSTKSGGTMYEVNLHVRFTFYGPAGDSVSASGWGEGTDMGDKATNKAMTGAMKYVLFQTFAIATAEQSENDSDLHSPEETVQSPEASEQHIVAVINRLQPIVEAAAGVHPQEWKDRASGEQPSTYALKALEQMVVGDRPRCLESSVALMNEVLDALGAGDAPAGPNDMGPCELCGSSRSQRGIIEGVVRCLNVTACKKRTADRDVGGGGDDSGVSQSFGASPTPALATVACRGCGVTDAELSNDADGVPWCATCWGAA